MLNCAHRVGRAARRRQAHQRILLGKAPGVEIVGAGRAIVFRGFDRARARFVAAGDDPLDHFRRNPKRGRTLRSIEHPESSGRSRADIEKTTALIQPDCYSVDSSRYLGHDERDSVRDTRILFVHQTKDFRSR